MPATTPSVTGPLTAPATAPAPQAAAADQEIATGLGAAVVAGTDGPDDTTAPDPILPGTGVVHTTRGVLAVVAHPDDESFGLGAILSAMAGAGARTSVLCFTHGEASTLHGVEGDLATIRAAELTEAGAVLGVGRTELLDHPDGRLHEVPIADLVEPIRRMAAETRPSHLLVFDLGGVTGHPDHDHATRAALAAARELGLPVLAWTLPASVAETLNGEFGTAFVGRAGAELGERVTVDRTVQWRAIGRHKSQSADNPVLYRRLELLGDTEYVRPLASPETRTATPAPGPGTRAGRAA